MSGRKEKHGKKRKKSYYIKCAHKKPKRENNLCEDMKGFLVTCNSNEKQAVREMYNLLNEYADKLYGPEELKKNKDNVEGEDESGTDDDEEDMEKAMEKEIQAMKNVKPTQRRFQNVNTKAKNCIFIRTMLEEPCQIMHGILSELAKSGVQKTRYAIRALPIQGTCKAHISDIEKLAKEICKIDFQTPFGTGLKFSIVFKSRNNNGIGRVSVIPAVAQIISDMNPLHKVNHDDPDLVILVEIVGTICCLSVVRDFYHFRKYNLQEVTRPKQETGKREQNEVISMSKEVSQLSEEVTQTREEGTEKVTQSTDLDELMEGVTQSTDEGTKEVTQSTNEGMKEVSQLTDKMNKEATHSAVQCTKDVSPSTNEGTKEVSQLKDEMNKEVTLSAVECTKEVSQSTNEGTKEMTKSELNESAQEVTLSTQDVTPASQEGIPAL